MNAFLSGAGQGLGQGLANIAAPAIIDYGKEQEKNRIKKVGTDAISQLNSILGDNEKYVAIVKDLLSDPKKAQAMEQLNIQGVDKIAKEAGLNPEQTNVLRQNLEISKKAISDLHANGTLPDVIKELSQPQSTNIPAPSVTQPTPSISPLPASQSSSASQGGGSSLVLPAPGSWNRETTKTVSSVATPTAQSAKDFLTQQYQQELPSGADPHDIALLKAVEKAKSELPIDAPPEAIRRYEETISGIRDRISGAGAARSEAMKSKIDIAQGLAKDETQVTLQKIKSSLSAKDNSNALEIAKMNNATRLAIANLKDKGDRASAADRKQTKDSIKLLINSAENKLKRIETAKVAFKKDPKKFAESLTSIDPDLVVKTAIDRGIWDKFRNNPADTALSLNEKVVGNLNTQIEKLKNAMIQIDLGKYGNIDDLGIDTENTSEETPAKKSANDYVNWE